MALRRSDPGGLTSKGPRMEIVAPAALELGWLFAEVVIAAALASVAMLFVFAQLTGWRRLASRFPAPAESPEDVAYRSRGVVVGPLALVAPPLRVRLGPEFLTLRPSFPFSVAFGGVALPWTDVHEVSGHRYALFETLELSYGAGDSATIGFLPSDAANAIKMRVESEAARS